MLKGRLEEGEYWMELLPNGHVQLGVRTTKEIVDFPAAVFCRLAVPLTAAYLDWVRPGHLSRDRTPRPSPDTPSVEQRQ